MTKRSVKEIETDIDFYEDEYRKLFEKSYKDHHLYNVDNIRNMNKLTRHITNLKLELNRAKMRDFEEKARK